MQSLACFYCESRLPREKRIDRSFFQGAYCKDALKESICTEYARVSHTGLCAGHFYTKETDIFYDRTHRWDEAVAVCNDCGIIDICREFAINTQRYGVWGGLKPPDIIRTRRMRERKAKESLTHPINGNNYVTSGGDTTICGL